MNSGTSAPCVYGRPLLQLAREIGRHLATLHRWREHGVLDTDGNRHMLFMTRVGGLWYVRDEDLRAFFDALAGRTDKGQSADRDKDLGRVGRELDAAGIK